MSVSAAKSRLMGASMYMESGRYGEVDSALEAAEGFLVGLPEEETAEIVAQIAAMRLAANEALVAEQIGVKVRAAQRELNAAKDYIDGGSMMPDGIEERIRKGEEYLDGVPDADKAPLVAEIEVLRGRLAGNAPAPASEPSSSAAPVQSGPSDDDRMNISRARSAIVGARSYVESRRTEGVLETLDEAASFLTNVSEAEKGDLLAEIDMIRAQAAGVENAENIRRVESELNRHFSEAENGQAWRLHDSLRAINYITNRLAEDDVRSILPAETMERYQARLVTATTSRLALIKSNALERSAPQLREIEERLATDPFAGISLDQGFTISGELQTLKDRVLHDIRDVPEDDADLIAINARLAAADHTIEVAMAVLAKAKLEADVTERWRMVSSEFDGWEQESIADDARPVEAPQLPKTTLAITRISYLLGGDDTRQLREEHADNEVVVATYRAAEEAFEAAAEKLNAAYIQVLDVAEQQPTPMSEIDRTKPLHLESAARTQLEDTRFQEPVIARIQKLDERWKAELAAIMQGRQDLYDKLAIEAAAAWPAIVEATGATEDFDPSDTGAQGKTVLLRDVYNRSGWEFSGYDFARRVNGIPVGGSYEGYVQKALEHAWYELKLDVNDRITWDIIAVVEGPGKIGERTNRTLKDASTGREMGKIEEWPPVECIRVRVIGLHAGPVAVGPQG